MDPAKANLAERDYPQIQPWDEIAGDLKVWAVGPHTRLARPQAQLQPHQMSVALGAHGVADPHPVVRHPTRC